MKIENLPYFHSIQQVFRLFVVDIMILVVFQLDLAHKFFIRCVISIGIRPPIILDMPFGKSN